MLIVIEDLKPEPLHVRHVYQPGDIQFRHEDAVLVKPVTTDFVLTHRDLDLRIKGTVETGVSYKCSRCVNEFSMPLSASFDLYYLPQPKPSSAEEIALKYEDMEVGFYDGIALDVDLMVLEQIELATPMRFVCREDCKGLCFTCGADLNEGPCLCRHQQGDPRMATLLEFRKKMKE